jgi:glyceraldehyde-3-phosphate dehydrogenase type I
MGVRVGINGFGRIGRNFFRAVRDHSADIEVVAVNDITDAPTLAHLLKYDSVLGILDAEVKATGDGITVDGQEFRVLAERDPGSLPWKEIGADVVIESTGLFTDFAGAENHLKAGAKRVVLSAPTKDPDKVPTLLEVGRQSSERRSGPDRADLGASDEPVGRASRRAELPVSLYPQWPGRHPGR